MGKEGWLAGELAWAMPLGPQREGDGVSTCCCAIPGGEPPASTPSGAFVGRELCSFVVAHWLEQLCYADVAHPSGQAAAPPLPSPSHLLSLSSQTKPTGWPRSDEY